jgi:hypothetical protein
VLRIRIRRIRLFFGLTGPASGSVSRVTDPRIRIVPKCHRSATLICEGIVSTHAAQYGSDLLPLLSGILNQCSGVQVKTTGIYSNLFYLFPAIKIKQV